MIGARRGGVSAKATAGQQPRARAAVLFLVQVSGHAKIRPDSSLAECAESPTGETHSSLAVFLAVGFKFKWQEPSIHEAYSLICDSCRGTRLPKAGNEKGICP